jgi:hypothetical protein
MQASWRQQLTTTVNTNGSTRNSSRTCRIRRTWPRRCAFTLGYIVRLGPWRSSPGFQDALAALSLVAMLGLVAETVIVVFINPNLLHGLDLRVWEAILTGAVAFYFGARS